MNSIRYITLLHSRGEMPDRSLCFSMSIFSLAAGADKVDMRVVFSVLLLSESVYVYGRRLMCLALSLI
jgi:hypothetical protein